MYWEALGFPGAPASQAVEDMAQWVQWAWSGIMGGASENEDDIRWNLNQFWALQVPAEATLSGEELDQVHQLNVRAHGILYALDDGKLISASPSYWSYWKAFWTGGTPPRPDTPAIAMEAKQAALDAAKGAAQAGDGSQAAAFTRMANQVDADLAAGNGFWTQTGINPGGVPLWVWGLGLGLAALFVYGRAKR